jgi:hypothetical protein
MADFHVAAHGAAFNGAVALPSNIPSTGAAQTLRVMDRFSALLTAFAVAHAQQRRVEAAAHEPILRSAAQTAWTTVIFRAQRLIQSASGSAEDRAFVAFALVIERLAAARSTPSGVAFHQNLLADPADILGLFRHARSDRADTLMCAAFNAIDQLTTLKAFGARPAAPDPIAAFG